MRLVSAAGERLSHRCCPRDRPGLVCPSQCLALKNRERGQCTESFDIQRPQDLGPQSRVLAVNSGRWACFMKVEAVYFVKLNFQRPSEQRTLRISALPWCCEVWCSFPAQRGQNAWCCDACRGFVQPDAAVSLAGVARVPAQAVPWGCLFRISER